MDTLSADRNVRVVILRSIVPGVFCAGLFLFDTVLSIYIAQ